MKFSNFVPVLAAILAGVFYWWFSYRPAAAPLILLTVLVFNLLAAWANSRASRQKLWWNFALLPILAESIVLGYLTIVSTPLLVKILAAGLVLLVYVYWRFVYFYLNNPARYTSFSLENLSFYVNFLLVFLLGALIFGLRAFLNYNLLLLLAVAALVLFLLIYQSVWMAKTAPQGGYLLVNLLVLVELLWAFSFLPLNHNLLGFLWAGVYYLTAVLFSDKLNGKLSLKRLRAYGALLAVSWLILFLSARWL